MTKRICVIGGGRWGQNHIKTLSQLGCLAAIADESLFGASQTATQFLAALVYRIGSDEKTAADEMITQKDVLQGLNNLRSSLSGVNLDEEAVNIIKYQRAYQASARYVGVLDSLSSEILQILGA